MNTFITNCTAKNLRKRLTDLIRKSEDLKFFVGFSIFLDFVNFIQNEKPPTAIKHAQKLRDTI